MPTRVIAAAIAAAARAPAPAARPSQPTAPPQGVRDRSAASASVEVPEGPDDASRSRPPATAPMPPRCRPQLKQALDAALAEATQGRAGRASVDVQTGNFSL